MLFYILADFQVTTPRKLAQPSPLDLPSTSTWPMFPTTAVPRTWTRNSSRECELRTTWWAGTTRVAESPAAESWTPCWRAKLSGAPIYRYLYHQSVCASIYHSLMSMTAQCNRATQNTKLSLSEHKQNLSVELENWMYLTLPGSADPGFCRDLTGSVARRRCTDA